LKLRKGDNPVSPKFHAYFDDSGHPNDQIAVVVSGFLSTELKWKRFSWEWRRALTTKSGKHLRFHMTDLMSEQGDFKGWTQTEKESLLQKLILIIRTHVVTQFSSTVLMDAYRRVNAEYALEECHGSPYALAGRTIVKQINGWKQETHQENYRVLMIFEDGTKGKGDFISVMKRDGYLPPSFRNNKNTPALQAADMLAWNVLDAIKSKRTSWVMSQLLQSPDNFGVYTYRDLIGLCKTGQVSLRSKLLPNTKIVFLSERKRPRKRTITS
jgi:hypothetical protein